MPPRRPARVASIVPRLFSHAYHYAIRSQGHPTSAMTGAPVDLAGIFTAVEYFRQTESSL